MIVIPIAALALAAWWQQPQSSQGSSSLPPSPIARVVVTPAIHTVPAGDSLELHADVLDSAGHPIPDPIVRYVARGGQGHVDSTGRVIASAVGKLPLDVVALVPGTRPAIQRIEIDVIPAPASRIDVRTPIHALVVGQQLRLDAAAFSPANDPAREPLRWSSSAPRIVRVSPGSLVTGIAPGRAVLTATAGSAQTAITVRVLSTPVTRVTLAPAAPEVRQGDVIHFSVTARNAAGAQVSGLTPTWLFAPGNGELDQDGSFVGYTPGEYTVTASLGRIAASTVVHVVPRNVRRAVTVVGRLPRTAFPTSEVWVHPNGTTVYLGTHGGGDRLYAIDVSDPSHPTIVDSIQVNTRLINDMMTTPDGKYMVLTREGASDRKNGIVIASTEDPLHPKKIAEFTDGVTAGVHSSYVYRQEQYGTHAYITNDGTGALDVIDITDPYHPKQVGEYRTNRPDAGRYLHDVDVRDGLLYASYWNDGLVILDIGSGIRGGSPSNPRLVSQFKYDLDSLYRDVEAVSAPGFARGTHTAWRHGRYVFIADEVYRNGAIKGAKDASANRMYGTLQVIDVSDIAHPHAVAWYTPEMGGVHNVWVVADTLYLGAYNAGFHVFDISGELKGDLRAQGREIASLNTADLDGNTKNAAFTWGVVVNPKDGLAYVNDFNNGLWVVRIDPQPDMHP